MANAPARLGELEMLLLLAVLQLDEQRLEPYGSAIRAEVERRTRTTVSRGSIYVTLDRLEEKGFLGSRESAASVVRGHRPKRLFKITPDGLRSLRRSIAVMSQMQRGLEVMLGLG
jgi:DNA-binding PadR family transcriptional regulator